jgi:hypothetical protein
MFRWYQNSAKCYVYLSDVSANQDDENSPDAWKTKFGTSRWFTRGWTLQELIAPASVEFFSVEGKRLGDKKSLERRIQEITRIPVRALRGYPLHEFSFHERLLWATHRKTTVEEDSAYSLLGILDISITPIHGEGKEKAHERLLEEFNKSMSNPALKPQGGVAWLRMLTYAARPRIHAVLSSVYCTRST